MKIKIFNQEHQEKGETAEIQAPKYYKGMDALQRAQTILDAMKVNMLEFGSELEEAARQAGK